MTETTEPIRAAGVVVCSKFGRILMVRRTDGEGWAFPGGGIKDGETAEKAAFREFWEETGYRLGSVGKLFMRRIKDGVDFSTFSTSVEDEFIPVLNHEHDAFAWVDPMTTLDEAKLSPAIMPPNMAAAYADDFREEDHPRGSGEKGGQFVSKGEGGGGGGSEGKETPKSEKPASEAPKAASSPPSKAPAKAPPEETDPEIKRMAAKLAPASGKSVEAMAAKLAPLSKGVSEEKKAAVAKATKKFLATSAVAAVFSMIGKQAVAQTLSVAQTAALEKAGEAASEVVANAAQVAIGAAITGIGYHLGHDVATSGAIATMVGLATRTAINHFGERVGLGKEGLARKLLATCCKGIIAKFIKGKADAADDDDEDDVLKAIKLMLQELEKGEAEDEEKADGFADAWDDGFADAWDEVSHKRGQPENAGQFGPGGGAAKGKDQPSSPQEGKETSGTAKPASGAPGAKGAPIEFAAADPEAFIAARDKSKRVGFMSPLKPEDLAGHKLFMSADGKVGAAVDKDGDIQNVFNNGGPKGAGAHAMAEAIRQGGRMLDAYSGYLPDFYRQFGFEETGRMAFNPEFAHDPELSKDKPDVVFMAWKGYDKDGEEGALARATGNHKDWVPNVRSDRNEDDYDAAKARSKNAAGNVQRGGDGGDRDAGAKLGSKADARGDSHLARASSRLGANFGAGERSGFGDAYEDARDDGDDDGLSDAALDAIADAIARLDERLGRMDAAFADAAQFEESKHPRGQPKNKGQFAKGAGGAAGGSAIEPAEVKEPVEDFEEPGKDPSEGGKALKEANKAASPEEHEGNLKAAKASGEQMKLDQDKAIDKQHSQAIELVAAKADPKAAAKKVAGKKPSKLGDAPEELNKEALSPERLTEMSALPLFEGAGVPIKGSVTRKGGEVVTEGNYQPGDRNNTDVANDLVQRGQAWLKDLGYPNGRVDSTNATPEVNEALATTFAEEAKRALDAARSENPERSAANWYNTALDEAINVAALTHPEIKTDPHAKNAFSAAMAITSQDETVFSNARLADQAYESWKKNGGRFRLKKGDFKAAKQKMMLNNFAKYDKLMDTFGDEAGKAFLESEIKVKDYMKALKGPFKLTGPPSGFSMSDETNATLYGSALFGPKIGNGFFQNLIGNFEPVTQDKWFMRSFGRMTGTLRDVQGDEEGLVDKFSNLLEKGDPKNKIEPRKVAGSRAEIEQQALETYKAAEADYKKNGKAYQDKTKTRPLLYAAAIRMHNMIKGVQDEPGTPGDRKWRSDIVNTAREKLKGEGIDLSNADLQATMWYPEKTLWKRMGARGPRGGNADYSDAFQALAMDKGHDSADIERITGRKVKANLAELAAAATSDDEDDGLGDDA